MGIPWSHAARIREVLLYKQHMTLRWWLSAMDIQVLNMQQQFGSSDYGLFSIAFMLHFLHILDAGDVR